MKIRCKQPKGKSQSAYTLAEVIISVFLLATMAVSLFSALSYGFSNVQADREDLRATQILLQRTEAIRLCTWSQLQSMTFQTTYDPSGASNGSAGTVYYGKIETNSPVAVPSTCAYKTNMVQVTVTVNWTNYVGARAIAHSRTAQTQVARYGMQNYVWGNN